jgi:hypothetical protein
MRHVAVVLLLCLSNLGIVVAAIVWTSRRPLNDQADRLSTLDRLRWGNMFAVGFGTIILVWTALVLLVFW